MLKINKYVIIFLILIVIIYFIYKFTLKYYYFNFFKTNGYLFMKDYFSDKECNDIFLVINKELGSIDSEYTWNENNRKNLRVPLHNEIIDIIKKVYNDINLKKIWQKYTPHTVLSELSVFLSYPKAINQPWHRDINLESGYGNMITIGVALDDITENMGPLELYPKTTQVNDSKINDLFLKNKYQKKKMICQKGDLIIWDSKIIHRGGKNISSSIRPLFYFSFLEGNKPKPRDATYSLKSIYKGKIFVSKL